LFIFSSFNAPAAQHQLHGFVFRACTQKRVLVASLFPSGQFVAGAISLHFSLQNLLGDLLIHYYVI